ncbi:hypothetical protein pqer_cds_4 [Pandoravirus quercus]|uniref:Uncharacterized protein n=1 Tax=Pandoravirus quercus TaxID=2107709 RepID=A0A2U7U7M8_9VIRU|nr:hypothetical protein pqer_cds_3 [Pandoravirus quercus]YP_009482695.1 hypothetical protein pqer_cds_4 [Pandoravirus quercus]AVK74425.1 hypothetical protein pqer_cds_3 [Pandoravirus quercus]AVK74426.1 hypothetical protein pqer_cds_4 [Pandoravirus quercus]
MLISSAGSRQGHDGSRRQPAAVPRAQPQPQQQPRQEIPQQGHAPRPARIALVDPDRGRHGSQHPAPTPDRHQSRGPPQIAGRQGDHNRRGDNNGRKEEDSSDGEDGDVNDDESYEDEEGADEYRHQFDYNGARSTVDPVQDDEPICQVRCSAPRRHHDNDAAGREHNKGGEAEDDEEEEDSASAYSQDESDSQDDDDSEDEDDDEDDGYGTLVALCRRWRSARIQADALSATAKTLRHERKDLEKRLITHMSRRNIAKEDAFGSLPGGYRAKVTIVRAPTSCSVSDKVLSMAVYKRLSIELAHECALAEANKAAKTATRAKKRAPASALLAPQAKHPRRTSSETGSPQAASDRATRPDNVVGDDGHAKRDEEHADHSFSSDTASQDDSNDSEDNSQDDEDDDNGIVDGISLAEAIGAALAKARRDAQETLCQPRLMVKVVVYPARQGVHKHEPLIVPVMTDKDGNEVDDKEAWNRWTTMTAKEKRAMAAASKAAAAEAAARVELSPEAAQWAGRIYEIDQALERNRAEAGPLRALMAALTVDLPDAPSTTTTQSATTPNGNGDDDAKPINGRTKAAEAKRLRHAQHAAMRDRVAAYLAANHQHADERGGLAVRFISPCSATGSAGAPVTYRIRAVERARNGNMGVRRYATAAVSAAAASLAAVGLDPTRPYSPARLQQAFGDRGVRSHLLDALKRAIATERQACKPPLARNLVITKAPSGKRST